MSSLMSLPEVWTTDSNKALSISLVQGDGSLCGKAFHPQFTYPIFGDAETIYGYKNLTIDLKFGATDLLPFLHISYSEKLADKEMLNKIIEHDAAKLKAMNDGVDVDDEKSDYDENEINDREEDPEKVLRKFLPEDVYSAEDAWLLKLKESEESFKPPGEMVDSYNQEGSTFEVWRAPITDTDQLKLHRRMQIFVLFFIEGGSYIDEADDRWRIYSLYEKSAIGVYKFIGFSTAYSYLWYKDSKTYDSQTKLAADIESDDFFKLYQRKRISQFVILPPYQGKRHGGKLYNILMDEFYGDPMIKEVTVEDPNNSFDDMRDRCDIERLDRLGIWQDKGFGEAPVSKQWIQFAQQKTKLMDRQFLRCMEMALLRKLNKSNKTKYRNYRLQVKKRLYKHNKEALKDLDKYEKISRLDDTYRSVEDDYYRLLEEVPSSDTVATSSDKSITDESADQTSKNKGKGKRVGFLLDPDDTKRPKTADSS
ncbi:acyl-CoA N-acyltransferase [Dipodascopsis uninucleata]